MAARRVARAGGPRLADRGRLGGGHRLRPSLGLRSVVDRLPRHGGGARAAHRDGFLLEAVAGIPSGRVPSLRALARSRSAPGVREPGLELRFAAAAALFRAAPPAGPGVPRMGRGAARSGADVGAGRHAAGARLRRFALGAAPGGGGRVRGARRAGPLPSLRHRARSRARGRRPPAGRRWQPADLRFLRTAGARRHLRPVREPEPFRGVHADGGVHGLRLARPGLAALPATPGGAAEPAAGAGRAVGAGSSGPHLCDAARGGGGGGAHRDDLTRRAARVCRRPRPRRPRAAPRRRRAGLGARARARGDGAVVVRSGADRRALQRGDQRRARPPRRLARFARPDEGPRVADRDRLQHVRVEHEPRDAVAPSHGRNPVAGGDRGRGPCRRPRRHARPDRARGHGLVPRGPQRLRADARGDGHPGRPDRGLGGVRRPRLRAP